MSAKFIRPGAYSVSHNGRKVIVLAKHPCEALAIAARLFGLGEYIKVSA